MIILLLVVTGIVIYTEVPSLIKKQYWGELILFSILLITGFTLSLLLILGVNIPSPALFIEEIINRIEIKEIIVF